MRKKIVICLLAVIGSNTALSAQELPKQAMGKPKIFNDESQSYRWYEIVKTRQWGELGLNFWRVFVDRSGVNSYQSPSSNSKIKNNNLEFMHPYYIAKIEGDFALLYEEKYTQTNLQISKHAKAVGWVKLSELLLWTTCPRTKNQVYQKAIILKDVDVLKDGGLDSDVSPYYSKSPFDLVHTESNARANQLEFYFVFKSENGGAVLLAKECTVNENGSTIVGWMKRGNYTTWNDRVCYEPNFRETNTGYKAVIFSDKEKASDYKKNGKYDLNAVITEFDLPKQRWSSDLLRFPVVDIQDNIAQVGTIGSARGGASITPEKLAEVNKKIELLKQKIGQVNVVFVIDGTNSMKNYYQPVARAIKDAMRRDALQGANVRFGAVVYRNYADADVIEYKPLTADADGIASWLVSRQCHSVSDAHHEAMLYGLETALDKMGWREENTNFLVHIGDAGNAIPDAKGRTLDAVARKMASKKVNYLGFQANHPCQIAYHDFCSQMMKLMVKELQEMGIQPKSSDFKKKSHLLYEFSFTYNDIFIISAAYHYAEVNHSESPEELKRLIEEEVVNNNKKAEEALRNLEGIINSSGGGGIPIPRIHEVLKNLGFSNDEIDVIVRSNMVIKVKGYTSRTVNGIHGRKNVFVSSVFLAATELQELINRLSSVNKTVSGNRRKDLKEALKMLAKTYVGQQSDNVTVDKIMDEMLDHIKKETGRNPLGDVPLNRLEDPNEVPDYMIDEFINEINKYVNRLKQLQGDRSCYFTKTYGTSVYKYYYILIENMPFCGD